MIRKALSIALFTLGLAAAGAWIASYFWWPKIGVPWPTSGLRQTHDRGFLLLINGRVFVVRQRVDLTPASPGGPHPMVVSADAWSSPRDERTAYAIDSRTLGTMTIRGGLVIEGRPSVGGRAVGSVAMPLMQSNLVGTTWKRLGFSRNVWAVPQIAVNEMMATTRWAVTSIPLWPIILAAAPGAWLLYRARRARRWQAEGRCAACGYDLRESPGRCPECGRETGVVGRAGEGEIKMIPAR